jgi:DNA-directed RNA polymerase specialized sigma24 family protein
MYTLLERIAKDGLQRTSQPDEWNLIMSQIVINLLKTRKLCRSFKGQPLFGIYQTVYEQVYTQLLLDLMEKLQSTHYRKDDFVSWMNSHRDQAFKASLNDTCLKQFALTAQGYADNSDLRQYALTELVEAIRRSGRLCHPYQHQFSNQFYSGLYDEAVNKTLLYVCQKIDRYDPKRGNGKFMNWVNFRLERIITDSYHEIRESHIVYLSSTQSLDIAQASSSPSLLESVYACLLEDQGSLFSQTYIRNRPDATFQAIALARLSDLSWKEISTQFGISIPTLSSFFQRGCEKFRTLFLDYVQST